MRDVIYLTSLNSIFNFVPDHLKLNYYGRVAEHCYVTERANEERKKRPDYKPIIDYDGLPRHQSSNMVILI